MRIAIVMMVMLLMGCGPGVTGGGDNAKDNPPSPSPRTGPPPEWGELGCQKSSSCKDVVLNQKYDSLRNFFGNIDLYLDPYVRGLTDARVFGCARILGKLWVNYVGGDEFNQGFDALLLKIIDLDRCQAHHPIDEKIKQYFVSTEDYKNETSIR